MTLGGSDPVLISARQIRSYHQLSLNGLGMVLIQVNVKQMIRDLPKDWGDSVGDMMIADQSGNLVYSAHGSVLAPEAAKETLKHPGYDLIKRMANVILFLFFNHPIKIGATIMSSPLIRCSQKFPL